MRLVILESPFRGNNKFHIDFNVEYAKLCVRDCLKRGEAPLASHLVYTQDGILNDEIEDDRALGILAGLCWYNVAEACIVYTDLGITEGMKAGIKTATMKKVQIEYRKII